MMCLENCEMILMTSVIVIVVFCVVCQQLCSSACSTQVMCWLFSSALPCESGGHCCCYSEIQLLRTGTLSFLACANSKNVTSELLLKFIIECAMLTGCFLTKRNAVIFAIFDGSFCCPLKLGAVKNHWWRWKFFKGFKIFCDEIFLELFFRIVWYTNNVNLIQNNIILSKSESVQCCTNYACSSLCQQKMYWMSALLLHYLAYWVNFLLFFLVAVYCWIFTDMHWYI